MNGGSTNGSSINVVLFERLDISRLLDAYDPLDMAGESIDRLASWPDNISLADRILPGFTTITHVPRYLCMLCRALQIALETVGEVQNVTNRRRLVIEKIKLFERLGHSPAGWWRVEPQLAVVPLRIFVESARCDTGFDPARRKR